MSRPTRNARQKRYREGIASKGLYAIRLVIPAHDTDAFYTLADWARKHPNDDWEARASRPGGAWIILDSKPA